MALRGAVARRAAAAQEQVRQPGEYTWSTHAVAHNNALAARPPAIRSMGVAGLSTWCRRPWHVVLQALARGVAGRGICVAGRGICVAALAYVLQALAYVLQALAYVLQAREEEEERARQQEKERRDAWCAA